jgi:hypothetical protein
VVVNFAIIGFAVFHTTFASSKGTSEQASRISLAGFYVIMVMYSLTTVLDASQKLGELAGHAVRICDLIRAMGAPPSAARTFCSSFQVPASQCGSNPTLFTQSHPVGLSGTACSAQDTLDVPQTALHFSAQVRKPGFFSLNKINLPEHSHAFRSSGSKQKLCKEGVQGTSGWLAVLRKHEVQPLREDHLEMVSAFGSALPEHLRTETAVLVAPTAVRLPTGTEMHISVHSVATGQLRDVICSIFPDLPLHGDVLAVCTCQAMSPSVNRFLQVC